MFHACLLSVSLLWLVWDGGSWLVCSCRGSFFIFITVKNLAIWPYSHPFGIHLFPQVSSCLFIPSLLASWWAGWRLSFICPVFIVYCCWLEESKYAAPLVCLLSLASWCFCSCNASRWTMLPQWVWVYAGVSRIYFMWEVFIEWLVECGWQL